MAKRGLYKKALNLMFDDLSQQRSREDKLFENINRDEDGEIRQKPKSKYKGKKRANHKHSFINIVAWSVDSFDGTLIDKIIGVCPRCGKMTGDFDLLISDRKYRYLGEIRHYYDDGNGQLVLIDSSTYRKTVFVGGSDNVFVLQSDAKKWLVRYMNLGFNLVIGFNEGAGNTIKNYITENEYKKYKTVFRYHNKNYYSDCDECFLIVDDVSPTIEETMREFISAKKDCYVIIYNDHPNVVSFVWLNLVKIEKDSDIDELKKHFGKRR